MQKLHPSTKNIKQMISPFYHKRKRNISIHILKTNINNKTAINTLKLLFNTHPDVIKWSVDLEDVDKVLRVETTKNLTGDAIIKDVIARGFYCEPLV